MPVMILGARRDAMPDGPAFRRAREARFCQPFIEMIAYCFL